MNKDWNYRITIYTPKETVTFGMPFTCKGTVTKGLVSSNNKATLQIYGLAPETRNRIYQAPFTPYEEQNFVKIEAGYSEDGSMAQIFFGRAMQIYSQKSGGAVDVITHIEAMCLDLLDSQTSTTIAAGTSFKDAIKLLTQDFNSSELGALGDLNGTFLTDTTFEGNTLEQINKIADGGAFLDDGQVNVLLNNEALKPQVSVVSGDNNLLGTPVRKGMQADINFIMFPEIQLGQLLDIQSTTWSNFNGQYKVIGFTHDFLFSKSVGGSRTTKATLVIGDLAPQSQQNISGNTSGKSYFSTVKKEEVQPVGNETPASAIDVLRYLKNNNGAIKNTKITSDITWANMIGNDNKPQDRLSEIDIGILTNCYVTAQKLQTFCKTYFPGRRISINSGWRSTANNSNCGGKPNSQHLYGKAIDFVVNGVSTQLVGQTVKKYWSGGWQYTDPNLQFVHVDIRNMKTLVNDV